MEMRISIIIIVTLRPLAACVGMCLSAAGLAGCSGPGLRADVVTTTSVVHDLTSRLVGNRMTVHLVLTPGGDPHEFEPTARDLALIGRARVVVTSGGGLEPWFASARKAASPRGLVVDASDGVALREVDGEADPHIWQDPHNVMVMVANITEGLRRADPAGFDTYTASERQLVSDLTALDGELSQRFALLTNRNLVTNHDAFGYLAARYELVIVGSILPSFNTQAELSARDVTELVHRIRSAGVRTVFSESVIPDKTARVIAGDAGVGIVAGESSLFGDGLGPPGSGAADYFSMMRHNARVIIEGLAP